MICAAITGCAGGARPAVAVPAGPVPAPQPWRVVADSPLPADAVIVRLFDADHAPGIAGPVATPESARRILGGRLADGDRRHRPIVAGLPMFGYFWRGSQPPVVISLDDAHRAAAQANVELVRDPASASLHAVQPGVWELWIADEQTFAALRDAAASLGVTRVVRFIKR